MLLPAAGAAGVFKEPLSDALRMEVMSTKQLAVRNPIKAYRADFLWVV